MTDALADRCDALAGPVVALMQRCIEAQGNAALLPEVIDLLTPVREVVARGSDDVHATPVPRISARAVLEREIPSSLVPDHAPPRKLGSRRDGRARSRRALAHTGSDAHTRRTGCNSRFAPLDYATRP